MQSLHTIRESLLPATIGLTRGSSAISSLRPKPHVRITRTCYLRNFGCILRSATTTRRGFDIFNNMINSNSNITATNAIKTIKPNINSFIVNNYFANFSSSAKYRFNNTVKLIVEDGDTIEEILYHSSIKRINK
jgi:hypothetical protein